MIKEIVRLITPPIVMKVFRFFDVKENKKEGLFEGSDEVFKEIVKTCRVYGEYGCGQSTLWVAANTSALICAVDTSRVWVDKVKDSVIDKDRADIKWIDLGEVGDWGRPVSYGKREDFNQYTDWIWSQSTRPDCVLVDGRFRVACFLTSLLKAEAGTTIIFDDYTNRPYYHVVEELLPVARQCGRQAIFIVPKLTVAQQESAGVLLDKFRYVMD